MRATTPWLPTCIATEPTAARVADYAADRRRARPRRAIGCSPTRAAGGHQRSRRPAPAASFRRPLLARLQVGARVAVCALCERVHGHLGAWEHLGAEDGVSRAFRAGRR